MDKKVLGFAKIFFILLFSGCGTVGYSFDSSQVKNIQNNITNQADIIGKFGLPFKVGIENGDVMWTYQLDRWKLLGPAESKDLVILFDKNNIVKGYRYTTSDLE